MGPDETAARQGDAVRRMGECGTSRKTFQTGENKRQVQSPSDHEVGGSQISVSTTARDREIPMVPQECGGERAKMVER